MLSGAGMGDVAKQSGLCVGVLRKIQTGKRVLSTGERKGMPIPALEHEASSKPWPWKLADQAPRTLDVI